MMLLDYFGVFGWISKKRDEFQGSTPRHRDPTQQLKSTLWCGREGGLDKPWVR